MYDEVTINMGVSVIISYINTMPYCSCNIYIIACSGVHVHDIVFVTGEIDRIVTTTSLELQTSCCNHGNQTHV